MSVEGGDPHELDELQRKLRMQQLSQYNRREGDWILQEIIHVYDEQARDVSVIREQIKQVRIDIKELKEDDIKEIREITSHNQRWIDRADGAIKALAAINVIVLMIVAVLGLVVAFHHQ